LVGHYHKGFWKKVKYTSKVSIGVTARTSKYPIVKANIVDIHTSSNGTTYSNVIPSQNICPNDGRKYKLNHDKFDGTMFGLGSIIFGAMSLNPWPVATGGFLIYSNFDKPMWILDD